MIQKIKNWLKLKWGAWQEHEAIAFSYNEGLTMEEKREQIRRRKERAKWEKDTE